MTLLSSGVAAPDSPPAFPRCLHSSLVPVSQGGARLVPSHHALVPGQPSGRSFRAGAPGEAVVMVQSPEWCQVESKVLADSPSALGCGSELPTRGIAGRMLKSWSSLKQEASWAPSWASDISLAPLLYRAPLICNYRTGSERPCSKPEDCYPVESRPSPSLQFTPWQPLGHLW